MYNLLAWQSLHKKLIKRFHIDENLQNELPYVLDLIKCHKEAMENANDYEKKLDKLQKDSVNRWKSVNAIFSN